MKGWKESSLSKLITRKTEALSADPHPNPKYPECGGWRKKHSQSLLASQPSQSVSSRFSERSCLTHGKLEGKGGGSAIKTLAHPSLAAWVQSLRSIVEGER